MSDDTTEFDPDVAEQDAPPLPTVLVYDLDGGLGYRGATVSQATDPDGANIDMRCKVRLVIATDDDLLWPRLVGCMISEFGLSQADAEAAAEAGGATPPAPPMTEEAVAKAVGTAAAAARDPWAQPARPDTKAGMIA